MPIAQAHEADALSQGDLIAKSSGAAGVASPATSPFAS